MCGSTASGLAFWATIIVAPIGPVATLIYSQAAFCLAGSVANGMTTFLPNGRRSRTTAARDIGLAPALPPLERLQPELRAPDRA